MMIYDYKRRFILLKRFYPEHGIFKTPTKFIKFDEKQKKDESSDSFALHYYLKKINPKIESRTQLIISDFIESQRHFTYEF
mgnify:CR=1 FL=1